MALYRDRTVEIPKHTYRQKRARSGLEYIYLYTKSFRNEAGQSRHHSTLIGLYDPATGRMHPNDHYYELLDVPNDMTDGEIYNVGYAAVVEACFEDLGMLDTLEKAFGTTRAKELRSIAAYMVKEGCVMSYVDDFTEKEFFASFDRVLTSQQVSDLFESITESEMESFYRGWIPTVAEDGYLCYDVTSVSTYSQMTTEAEYGYNRDHDRLPQLNLGLFTSEKSRYPVYLFPYNGSVNDMSNVVYACKNAKAAGLEGKIQVVMDGGFFDAKKLRELTDEGLICTVGMPIYSKLSRDYVDQFGQDLYNPCYLLNYSGTYGKILEGQEVLGLQGRVFIGLCVKSREMLNDDLNAKIERYTMELRGIAKYQTAVRQTKYTNLFDIEMADDGKHFTFSLNREKELSARKYFGYFLIFTQDPLASPDDILRAYREKDLDEKMFYDIKVYMQGRRPRTHRQETFQGKYFAVLIALILRTWLKRKLAEYKKANHLTLKRCLMKLSDIRIYQDQSNIRFLKALTAEQRILLDACGVDVNHLESICKNKLNSR